MSLTFQLVVLLGLSSGLWMGANAKCPKKDECCLSCPEGWFQYNSRCLKFFAKELDWCSAESHCISEGGNLASILDNTDLTIFRSLVVKLTGHKKRTWLGGFDAVKEDCWQWADGREFKFTGWGQGEPNNWGPGEHCQEMSHSNTQDINDAPCDIAKSFLCARDLEKKP